MSLRIHQVPAGRGVGWMSDGFKLFFRHAVGFSLLFFIGLVATMLLMLLPAIGTIAMFVLGPLFTLGFCVGARAALAGEPVQAVHMLQPFLPGAGAARRRALFVLSLAYALLVGAILMITTIAGGDALERLAALWREGKPDAQQRIAELLASEPGLLRIVLLQPALIALVSALFWHAPMLVWWQGQGVAQSLFSSALACWRNKAAFLVYGLAWIGVFMLFLTVSGVVLGILGSTQALGMAALPVWLLFAIAFYVSVYFSHADSFASSGDSTQLPE